MNALEFSPVAIIRVRVRRGCRLGACSSCSSSLGCFEYRVGGWRGHRVTVSRNSRAVQWVDSKGAYSGRATGVALSCRVPRNVCTNVVARLFGLFLLPALVSRCCFGILSSGCPSVSECVPRYLSIDVHHAYDDTVTS
jgi:hypothetical protein